MRDRGRPVGPPKRRSNRDAGIGDERIRRPAEPRDDRVAGTIREVDEEAAARRVGRERQSEQAALAAGEDGRAQIEKVGGLHGAAAHHADPAGLFDDELHAAIERILDERDRAP